MELFLLVDIVNKVNALSNGEVEIGHVDTLAPGATATASITGKFPLQQLNLGIPRGTQGVPGPLGPVGPIGPTGLTGAPGANSTVPGPIGPKGDTGPQGIQGIQGKVGLTGGVGPAGPQGPIGPIGLTGNTGSQGAVGPVGPTGAASTVPGPTGPIGPQGLVGPTGAKGDTGAKGATGNTGPIGPLGPIGPEGPTGPEGVPGPQGPRGIPGVGEGDTLPSFWDGTWDVGPAVQWVEDPPGSGVYVPVYTDPLPGQVSFREADNWDPNPADFVFMFHTIDRDGVDQRAALLSAILGNTVVVEGDDGWISLVFRTAWTTGDNNEFIWMDFDRNRDNDFGGYPDPGGWTYMSVAAGAGFLPERVVHPTPLSGRWKRGDISYGVDHPEWTSNGCLMADTEDLAAATTLAFSIASVSMDSTSPNGPYYNQAMMSLRVGSRVFMQTEPNPRVGPDVYTGLLFELTSDPAFVDDPYNTVVQFDVTCIHSVGDANIRYDARLLVDFLPIPAGGGGGDTLPSFWDGAWDIAPKVYWVEDPPGSGEGYLVWTDPVEGQVSFRDAPEWIENPPDQILMFHRIDSNGNDQSTALLSMLMGNTIAMQGDNGEWCSLVLGQVGPSGDNNEFVYAEFSYGDRNNGGGYPNPNWTSVVVSVNTGYKQEMVVSPTPLSGKWHRGDLSHGIDHPEWTSSGDLKANNDDLAAATTLAFSISSDSMDSWHQSGPHYTQALRSLRVGSRVFIQTEPENLLVSNEVTTGLLFELTSDPVVLGSWEDVVQFDVTCIHSVGDTVLPWQREVLVDFLPVPASPVAVSGKYSGTTDATGDIVIPHTLGAVPNVVLLTPLVTGEGYFAMVYDPATTATNIQVVCFTATGTRLASTAVTINWRAEL